MAHDDASTTRRAVLRAVGGTAATAATGGLAGATPDRTVRANVGYSAESGRRAALAAADEVVHDFSFDALTLRTYVAALDALRGRSDLRYVEEEGTGHVDAQSTPWGIDRIDADRVHDNGDTGAGAPVAVLDTGIDPDHPDLVDNLGEGKAVEECFSCAELWGDDNDDSHGTHVAGIAGAVDNGEGVVGVAPGVTLHAVKVCDASGDCLPGDLAAGLDWVADRGYDVANMSISTTEDSVVEDAVEAAWSAGVLLVTSMGDDASGCPFPPAGEPEVLAVSATGPNDGIADYSCTGPEVDLAAPGGLKDGDPSTSVRSTVRGGGYGTLAGTSMAAPHVSGAGALFVAAGESNVEARDRLLSDAEDLGHPDDDQGAGLVDAYRGYPYFVVETDAAFPGTSITTLRGDLVDLGVPDSVEAFFEYKLSSSSIYSESARVTRSSPGLYDVDIATTTDTAYDFRAVAEQPDGTTVRGDVLTFRTPEDDGGGGTE